MAVDAAEMVLGLCQLHVPEALAMDAFLLCTISAETEQRAYTKLEAID